LMFVHTHDSLVQSNHWCLYTLMMM